MKLDFSVLLPELEVETNSEHGEIDRVFLDGQDFSNRSVAELIMAHFGEYCWREKIILETESALEATKERRI